MANSDSSGVISFIFFLIFAMLGPRCSSVVAAWALQFQHELSRPEACGILVPQPGIEPASLALEGQFLTYGPPGKSQKSFIYLPFIYFCTLHTHDLFILCLEVYTFGLLSPIVPTLPPGTIFMSIALSTNRSST